MRYKDFISTTCAFSLAVIAPLARIEVSYAQCGPSGCGNPVTSFKPATLSFKDAIKSMPQLRNSPGTGDKMFGPTETHAKQEEQKKDGRQQLGGGGLFGGGGLGGGGLGGLGGGKFSQLLGQGMQSLLPMLMAGLMGGNKGGSQAGSGLASPSSSGQTLEAQTPVPTPTPTPVFTATPAATATPQPTSPPASPTSGASGLRAVATTAPTANNLFPPVKIKM